MNQNAQGPTTYVSAGPNCHVAHWLKLTGLQPASYPFDWLLSHSHEGLSYVHQNISSDFSMFLKDLEWNGRGHVVARAFSRTELFHHKALLSEREDERAAERAKLIGRVARLREALCIGDVTFVYGYHLTPASASAGALKTFARTVDDFLRDVSQARLLVYFMSDDSESTIQWEGPTSDRLSVAWYVRNTVVSRVWGEAPAFMEGLTTTTRACGVALPQTSA
ncbi:MAG: DUF1796 family putative cysteine peptidase [Lautropia sp.]